MLLLEELEVVLNRGPNWMAPHAGAALGTLLSKTHTRVLKDQYCLVFFQSTKLKNQKFSGRFLSIYWLGVLVFSKQHEIMWLFEFETKPIQEKSASLIEDSSVKNPAQNEGLNFGEELSYC